MACSDKNRGEISITVQLSDILHYASGGSRLIVEGERVYKANHLLLVGANEVFEDGVKIFASCLKSTTPSSEPHKIQIRTKNRFEDWLLQCSCKAGLGKCKHTMAVLNHLLLHPSIPILSPTDLQQKWGRVAQKVAGDMYKATKLRDFCGSSKERPVTDSPNRSNITLSDAQATSIRNSFLQNFPESSLFYEVHGRPKLTEVVKERESSNRIVEELLNNSDFSQLQRTLSLESLISIDESSNVTILKNFLESAFSTDYMTETDRENMSFFDGPLEDGLSLFYELKVCVSAREAIDICCGTVEQRLTESWKTERSRRITASNAYKLYTYYTSKPKKSKNWRKKIIKIIVPQNIQCPAIAHGIRCEQLAVLSYERDFAKTVTKCGFVVLPHIPWLGCSPDGVILEEKKIIEIKCPFKGKTHGLKDVLDDLPYLTKKYKLLTEKHEYYAQVQLNMFILKCQTADFIVYSEFEDKCHVVTIQYDDNYVREMLVSLRQVYFNAFLKFVYNTHCDQL